MRRAGVNVSASPRVAIPALALALIAGGCRGDGDEPARQGPAAVVQTEVVRGTAVPNVVELPGRIEAVRSAQVRARVDGIVERQVYREGTDVAAGAVLFQIDPRDLRARLQQARASLASAKVARAHAATMSNRLSMLVGRRAVSVQENESAEAALRQAEAGLLEAQAAVERAQLQLGYATVRAPIAGRAGRAQVSEGALVSAGAATLMTQVDQLDPVFATFNPSSSALASLLERVEGGDSAASKRMSVALIMENGERFPHEGVVDFTEKAVDPVTGSRTLRARFDNPQRVLLPGQFIRGIVTAGTIPDGVSVPERAVAIGADEASVMTVNDEGVVARQPVTLAGQAQGRWIVASGLKPGERVVIDGWHKVQPGQHVAVAPADAKAKAAAP
ncbi:efflux RND transporter periplasmic adaptor subunit [Lysobacter auxotrophicus]|uniref:Efflux RND transporter periplasmic adaptor subunit n=1 Tax=Lysobacter auxotrophicus TaxID=2992573 RepID=A0ABM8DDN3_9GAMM|nr:efflux RND transporter periplasmic adaptor subunit [Lysobacter auxotrophicus]BDU16707.1 efflux RND transporter periplasmic adaptor subunit [Lysobacter auxotrophicus]